MLYGCHFFCLLIVILLYDVSAQAAFYDFAVEGEIAVDFAVEFDWVVAFDVNFVANEMLRNV